MSRKVYIASHDQWAAVLVRDQLYKSGFEVASTWHDVVYPNDTKSDPLRPQRELAERDISQIRSEAAALTLLATPKEGMHVSGGKFSVVAPSRISDN
jgi:hypothetical protein